MFAIVLLLLGGTVYLILSMQKSLGYWVYGIVLLLWLLALTLIWTGMLKHLYRLEVSEQGIKSRHILGGKEQFYPLDRLQNIDIDTEQISNANGPLTEPFTELYLDFGQHGTLYLSPRIYQNFYELALFTVRLYNEQSDKRLEEMARKLLLQKLLEYEQRKR